MIVKKKIFIKWKITIYISNTFCMILFKRRKDFLFIFLKIVRINTVHFSKRIVNKPTKTNRSKLYLFQRCELTQRARLTWLHNLRLLSFHGKTTSKHENSHFNVRPTCRKTNIIWFLDIFFLSYFTYFWTEFWINHSHFVHQMTLAFLTSRSPW